MYTSTRFTLNNSLSHELLIKINDFHQNTLYKPIILNFYEFTGTIKIYKAKFMDPSAQQTPKK